MDELDAAASQIVAQQQAKVTSLSDPIHFQRPSDLFRKRLYASQILPASHPFSIDTDALEAVSEEEAESSLFRQGAMRGKGRENSEDERASSIPTLGLPEVLLIGALNSATYQKAKEDVFRAALNLDLERHVFRHSLAGLLQTMVSTDRTGDSSASGNELGFDSSLGRRFEAGAEFTLRLGLDLVRLLTGDHVSSFGIFGDASLSLPLMRGAGRAVVTEEMTQAERNVWYALLRFDQLRRSYAVDTVQGYLLVLQQLDEVRNRAENYRLLQDATRRVERLAEAGRLPESQVGQARQDELRSRERWIVASQSYERLFDRFKIDLGLPPDAKLLLSEKDLLELTARISEADEQGADFRSDSEDSSVLWHDQGGESARLSDERELEMIRDALRHRPDLRIAIAEVYDRQRAVEVAADGLRAELSLLATASAGESRSIASASADNARLRPDRGQYDVLLSLDLPLDRRSEQIALRNELFNLESVKRNLQQVEDSVKFEVRNDLREVREAKESVRIQGRSLAVAERRVKNTRLLLEAGRVQIRDLLEAQEALVSAKNSLTAARVRARVAELALLRDTGLLVVDSNGMPAMLEDDI